MRFPRPVELALARLVDEAPAGSQWLHEMKYDGYRIVLHRHRTQVRLHSRNALDWTTKLPQVRQALLDLPCASCILDGELVALDDDGRASFNLLQQWMGSRPERCVVFVFDLLFLDGRDVSTRPLVERKAMLSKLLGRRRGALRPASYLEGHGPEAFARACRENLEGIISKIGSAPYRGGRTGDWVKTKCVASDEYVIIGYTPGKGARERLGSVLLAKPQRDGRSFRYAGRVGSGFTQALIDELFERVEHRREPVPLVETPSRTDLRGARPTWVEPRIVVEVNYRGITADGRVRQGSIKGMRPDKSVADLKFSDRQVRRRGAKAVAA